MYFSVNGHGEYQFHCFTAGCGEAIINEETTAHVAEIFRQEGSDAWWLKEAKDLLPDGFTCPKCGGSEFSKEMDIMDVWFDSGVSHCGATTTR